MDAVMKIVRKTDKEETDIIGPKENPILKRLDLASEPDRQPEFDCAACSDTGRIFVKVPYRGNYISEVKKCECVLRKVRARQLAAIPEQFRDVSLDDLQPDNSVHPKQSEYVLLLKANPTAKYVIMGDFGTGKTHFFWCLYREAVKRNRKVYANTLRGLISEFQKAIELSQQGERYMPPLDISELRQSKEPYSIFLDDIDKARATEYAAEQLFELVNACYEYGHQLVVTTNLCADDLLEHFKGADKNRRRDDDGFGRYGGAIVRRLLDKAFEIEMF